MAKYPDWVYQFKPKGHSIKKVGNQYYLYKTSSRYVKGMKNPQPYSTYVGVITQNGVVETKKKVIETSNVRVREYGFSKAIREICPDAWKAKNKDRWERILTEIIIGISPDSYLKLDPLNEDEKLHVNLALQKKSLENCIGFSLAELEPLKTIYQVEIGKEKMISEIRQEHRRILDAKGITLCT